MKNMLLSLAEDVIYFHYRAMYNCCYSSSLQATKVACALIYYLQNTCTHIVLIVIEANGVV